MIEPLTADRVVHECKAAQLPFSTTDELDATDELFAQQRAAEALDFAVSMPHPGYNLFVMGQPGSGRRSLVRQLLSRRAPNEETPSDWCYVNNFSNTHCPIALPLPPGSARPLSRQIDQVIAELRVTLPAAFEDEEYRVRLQQIENGVKQHQEEAYATIGDDAMQRGVTMIRTPGGFAFAPAEGGMVDEGSGAGDGAEERFDAEIDSLQQRLERVSLQLPRWQKEAREAIVALHREMVSQLADHALEELVAECSDQPQIQQLIEAVRSDLVDRADELQQLGEERPVPFPAVDGGGVAEDPFQRYRINPLVDHEPGSGAPLVFEDNPTLPNLVGRIEHQALMGALVTDFTLIKPGALHRANGGYLVIDADRLLEQPHAWDALKRMLRTSEVRIESPDQASGVAATISLEPEAVGLHLKVVLIGSRDIYYLLAAEDPEFGELFKVIADFDETIERNETTTLRYARWMATLIAREALRPFDSKAVARVIDHSARLAGDASRLTMQLRAVADLQREANHWAGVAGTSQVGIDHVEQALAQWRRRHDRIRCEMLREIEEGILHIATDGAVVGQINGLSVIDLGDYSFGHPTRITATVRPGEGEIIDIEREVELGGPIHSKGVMILSALIGARYAHTHPLSLAATLVFEQSYAAVDGDSASAGELCALLSALSGVAINQRLAITGAVDQHGRIQPVGGINEKIEGFHTICSRRGLVEGQGVILPAANLRNLMLEHEVVDAVAAGRFRLYAVESIDEAIALLTGMDAGELDSGGKYPAQSVNGRVQWRIDQFARQRLEGESGDAGGSNKPRIQRV